MDPWRTLLVVVLAVLTVRIAWTVRAVACGKMPWTRLLLPGIVWIEAVGLAGHGMWQLRLATALALELAFLVIALRALRRRDGHGPLEVRIARSLEALVPPMIAKLAAVEIVLVSLAVRFLVGGWRRPAPAGVTYHRESGLRTMLPILPLLGIGDILLLELVILPHAGTGVRVIVHAFAAYGLVWLVGVYAAIRARPHELVDGTLVLHRGVFRTAVVDLAQVASIAPLPDFGDDWKARAYKRGATRLDIGGAPVLELRLHDGARYLVAVDDPAGVTADWTRRAARVSMPA